ncbi:MAG: hydrogenase expression/formation protein [Gammaproteobacteria bacterium]|nr:hydrogenase expression/formation protein [Gammaproteobacteria bacterium]
MGPSDVVIPVYPVAGAPSNGMTVADALIQELAAALVTYLRTQRSHVIDLTCMPLSGEDKERLDAYLGLGETSMDIHALLRTRIEETRYAGVWRVRHYGPDDTVQSERIEVIDVPEIARASTADIGRSAQRLAAVKGEEGVWQTKP